ncbi:MAG TPA: MmcQ/YjbR family DNA-binding protein, partial [Bacteroidales bacterium]|nr:MmcQ/YjbR family DNA-binding protein [Bacteroidales bacterium]
KVGGKMFALIPTDELELSISLKCDPGRALELREHFPTVSGAWHMNKVHWNTVRQGPGITDELLREWIDHSYALIVASLPRKEKEKLKGR